MMYSLFHKTEIQFKDALDLGRFYELGVIETYNFICSFKYSVFPENGSLSSYLYSLYSGSGIVR